MIFNEDKLQEEIIKTWGEFGVHNEVFTAMRKQINDLKQLTLTDVTQAKRPACPDCFDRGELRNDKEEIIGTCPCHY